MDDASGAGVAGGDGLGVSGSASEAAVRRPVGGGPGITGWRGRDPGDARRWYGPEVENEILRRVAAGETLAGVCACGAEEGLPSLNTVLAWASGKRVGFAARLDAARRAAGRGWSAPKTPFCTATCDEIVDRLCEGEGMVAICRDPALPNVRTVYRWMLARSDLRDAVQLAREIQADRVGELAFDEAMATTPANARAVEVRLRHLRWYAAKLAATKYGSHRAEAPPKPEVERAVTLRSFKLETRADGWRRVRGSHYSPTTGQIVDEPPGPWQRPPGSGSPEGEAGAPAHARPPPPDPEGWR
jgi:hypothetical protein